MQSGTASSSMCRCINPPLADPKIPPNADECAEITMKKAKLYGLRLLNKDDHLPEPVKRALFSWGRWVLIREGNGVKDPSDQLRDCFEFALSADPNMGTFLVCYNPWSGDEFWIGFGVGERIGCLLEIISGIESKIGTQSDVDPDVKAKEREYYACADRHAASSAKDGKSTYESMTKARTAWLQLKAEKSALTRKGRQSELDALRAKIDHLRSTLHRIAAQFLSAWSLVLIPRFGLKNMIKCGGGSELGDKQKAILSYLAHCKFLERLKATFTKTKNDLVEVIEVGSTANCSNCNSKNSPGFSRFYHCRHCKLKMTRDGNAAKNIFKMALATVLIHLIDDFPLWKYLDDDDDGDSDVEGDDEMDVDGDWPHKPGQEDTLDIEMSDYGSKDDDAGGGGKGSGTSRAVGSGNKNDLGPLLAVNVVPDGLTRLATRSKAVDSNPAKQGSLSMLPSH
jgi:hypothetical protein